VSVCADRQADCLTVADWFSYCDRTATFVDCRSSARARAYRVRGNSFRRISNKVVTFANR
jgi:hypothetical protein